MIAMMMIIIIQRTPLTNKAGSFQDSDVVPETLRVKLRVSHDLADL